MESLEQTLTYIIYAYWAVAIIAVAADIFINKLAGIKAYFLA